MSLSVTHDLIPGGAHTYSKGDDQFPANAPRHLEKGLGCRVWDRNGNEYLDWTMALRAMSLGYGHKAVNEAAIAQIWRGSNFGRPSYIETELAEDLVDLVPSAEMVKFAKNGSTVTTAAVKLARARTGRDKVAICADHPFFSYDDWFIGATAMDAGVPQVIKELTVKFRYNDVASVERVFAENRGEIACVILEPAGLEEPEDQFLSRIGEICRREGAVYILDEMVTGFRWHLNGAQTLYDVDCDLCTFGKGMGNGYSVAALVGKREIMDLGGLFHDMPRVFLISTTHGAENHALAASRAVIQVFRQEDVVGHMWRIGRSIMEALEQAAASAGVATNLRVFGIPCNPAYAVLDAEGAVSFPLKTLFLQEMVKQRVLIPYLAPSYAHTESDVARTAEAAEVAFRQVARALDDGWERFLEGPPVKPVFRTFN